MRRRLAALKIYTLRVLFNSRTNAPFISGDGMANLCEVSMYSPMWRRGVPSATKIKNASTIFIPGHRLDEFLQRYEGSLTARVLVIGNSDRDYFSVDFQIPKSVKLILLQNSHVSGDSIETMPIGIENLRYGRNGFKRYFKCKDVSKVNKVLVGPYSMTHSERVEINQFASIENPKFTVLTEHVSPKHLASIASKYSFIACPRGNGTDTHRFWETLYRGSIPIVKRSAWSTSLRKHGFPFIEVESWSLHEIDEVVESYRGPMQFNPKEIPALWLPYWNRLIQSNSQ